jgi:nucleotide-binding universal stress UspA family protein
MPRFPPRRILVAVDLSKEALFAWNAAKEIAKRFGAVLEAVWCVEPMVNDRAVLRVLARNAGYHAESVKRLRARLGPGARLHAVNGDPVLGTTVERVLRHCRIPVLAIPSY